MIPSLVAAGRQSSSTAARLARAFSASAMFSTDALQAKDATPFLRFGNPVATDVGMSQHLPSLPETKVRAIRRRRENSSCTIFSALSPSSGPRRALVLLLL